MKVKRKQSEPPLGILLLVLSPRETEHLKELKAILRSESVISQQRIGQVQFLHIGPLVARVGQQGREGPARLLVGLLVTEQRADRLQTPTRRKRESKLVNQRTALQFGGTTRQRVEDADTKSNADQMFRERHSFERVILCGGL